jgi:tetratricopeptide (TPR) repeat protein
MMKPKIILTAVFLLSCLSGAAFASDKADQLYSEGVALYRSGKYVSAEKRFMDALSDSPKSVSALFMMGEVLSKDIRRLKEAEGWYKKALRDGGGDRVNSPKTLLSLGVLYIQMGNYEDALARLNELKAGFPDFYDIPKAYNHMGVASYRLDRYDEAMSYFKTALKLNPDLLEAIFNMKTLQGQLSLLNTARYYQRLGDLDAAVAQYNSALDLYPNYVAAWYHLGTVYLEKKDYGNAVRSLTRARALNPGYLGGKEVPYQVAEACSGRAETGDLEEALAVYQRNPSYKDSLLKAGLICIRLGRLDEAEKDFRAATAAENAKLKAEAWYQLGVLGLKKPDKEGASECFQKALELVPGEARYQNPPPDDARK